MATTKAEKAVQNRMARCARRITVNPKKPELESPLALPKTVAQWALALSLVQCARGSSVIIGSEECYYWAQAERCHDVLPRGQIHQRPLQTARFAD
jgi:hypothetical protein